MSLRRFPALLIVLVVGCGSSPVGPPSSAAGSPASVVVVLVELDRLAQPPVGALDACVDCGIAPFVPPFLGAMAPGGPGVGLRLPVAARPACALLAHVHVLGQALGPCGREGWQGGLPLLWLLYPWAPA